MPNFFDFSHLVSFAAGAGIASIVWFIRVRSLSVALQYAKQGIDKVKGGL